MTSVAGKIFPGIPGACATRNFPYLVRGPCSVNIIISCTLSGVGNCTIWTNIDCLWPTLARLRACYFPKLPCVYVLLYHIAPRRVTPDVTITWSRGKFSLMKIFELQIKFHWGPIDNMSALVQVMAWCRPGDKPLPEPMLTELTRSQLIKWTPLSIHVKRHLINNCIIMITQCVNKGVQYWRSVVHYVLIKASKS